MSTATETETNMMNDEDWKRHVQLIRDAEKDVSEAARDWEELRKESAAARKHLRKMEDKLHSIIRRGVEPTLFPDPPRDAEDEEDDEATESRDEPWRAEPVMTLSVDGIGPATVTKLEAEGYKTYGDLANAIDEDFDFTTIKGMQRKIADRIVTLISSARGQGGNKEEDDA